MDTVAAAVPEDEEPAGTWLEPGWDLVGTWLEPGWNLLEPGWDPLGLAGTFQQVLRGSSQVPTGSNQVPTRFQPGSN